jgi:hypothetical protein
VIRNLATTRQRHGTTVYRVCLTISRTGSRQLKVQFSSRGLRSYHPSICKSAEEAVPGSSEFKKIRFPAQGAFWLITEKNQYPLTLSVPDSRIPFQRVVFMKVRMVESVTRVQEIQLPGGRIYTQSYALSTGNIYDLAPEYAQKLLSGCNAVSVEDAPLPASGRSQRYGTFGRTGLFALRNLASYA